MRQDGDDQQYGKEDGDSCDDDDDDDDEVTKLDVQEMCDEENDVELDNNFRHTESVNKESHTDYSTKEKEKESLNENIQRRNVHSVR